MREEIAAAVVFLTRIVKKNSHLTAEQIQEFSDRLSASLVEKFKNHWYLENPLRGQGYRCIRINETDPVDSVLDQAAQDCGLTYKDLKMPQELTLWVDPREVCCRLGEVNGMYCTLASFQESGEKANQAGLIDIDNLLERHQQRRVTNNAYHFRSSYRPSQHHHVNNNNVPPPSLHYRQTSPTWHNNLYNQVLEANHAHKAASNQWHKNGYSGHYSPGSSPPSNNHNINRVHHSKQKSSNGSQGDKYRWVRGTDLIRA